MARIFPDVTDRRSSTGKMPYRSIDLRCCQDEYLLQCGDPTPPHLSLVELRYTLADLDDLDLNGRDNRAGSFKLVNFEGLPEILRALGHRVEKKG
jgi:hypothetical protein